MKALFIGRFQPFHNGHLEIIRSISTQYHHIIIGIGSAQYQETQQNPFSLHEREKMIRESLKLEEIKNYRIIAIPDIHNPSKWVEYVCSLVSDFDIVISNDSFTQQLFYEKGYQVKNTKMFQREIYSGNEIRKRIKQNKGWEEVVPPPVINIIKSHQKK